MTRTVMLVNTDYETFAKIRRAMHDANPTAIVYESYDKEDERAIFTFKDQHVVPPELENHVIPHVIPKRADFSNIDIPPAIIWYDRNE